MDENATSTPINDHAPALRLGATLRETRQRMGLSIADVAAQIRLAPRQIEALEAEDWQSLPELPFLRGFVRSYAKLLQLDDAPLLATLPNLHPAPTSIEPLSVEVPFDVKQLSQGQNRLWLVATAVILVVVAGFALWHFSTPKMPKVEAEKSSDVQTTVVQLPEFPASVSAIAGADPDAPTSAVIVTPAPQAVSAPIASAVAAAPVVAGAAGGKLRLVFEGESWTQVTDATGKVLSSQMNATGSELNLNGQPPYDLVVGHAQAVHVYRAGQAVDLSAHINAVSEVARLTLE